MDYSRRTVRRKDKDFYSWMCWESNWLAAATLDSWRYGRRAEFERELLRYWRQRMQLRERKWLRFVMVEQDLNYHLQHEDWDGVVRCYEALRGLPGLAYMRSFLIWSVFVSAVRCGRRDVAARVALDFRPVAVAALRWAVGEDMDSNAVWVLQEALDVLPTQEFSEFVLGNQNYLLRLLSKPDVMGRLEAERGNGPAVAAALRKILKVDL